MRIFAITLFCCSILAIPSNIVLAQATRSLPRSTPEAQGVSSIAVLEFIESANDNIDSLHSFMLVRNGIVVAEGWWKPYDAATRHQLYSLSKSFTSTAVGLAIAEGKLSLDDEVTKFFPDELPESPSNNLKSMRVRDLLCMSTGQDSEPKFNSDTAWTKAFLAQPVPFKPGTHFLYNTPATYMCSAIVQKQTGQTVLDFLGKSLFEPLGIDNPNWGTSPQGVSLGGYGLNVRTEDIAKFGQLYLQRGKWEGRQLIPSEWIDMATAKQTSNGSNPKSDWDQGYGFQFWRSRHNCYRGDGAFGQYCIVMPQQDSVIAITSGVKNMPAVLDLVWDKLLPGITDQPLPVNEAATDKLQSKLGSLVLPSVVGRHVTDFSQKLSNRRFAFEQNDQQLEAATWRLDDLDKATLLLSVAGTEHTIALGTSQWLRSDSDWGAKDAATPIATTAAWTSNDECTVKVCFVETPFVQTMRFRFVDEQVRLDVESNVAFGPTKKPTVVGK